MGGIAIPSSTDVAIVGGGMVGLSLALLLGRTRPERRVMVLEAANRDVAPGATPLSPGFDARSTALSESSRVIYSQAGIWHQLESIAEPIAAIHVSDRGHPGVTRIDAEQTGIAGLGYVVENPRLGAVLKAAVEAMANVQLLAPVTVEGLQPLPDAMLLSMAGQSCKAGLAVVADGAESALLKHCGIATRIRDYGQQALIANIGLRHRHRGIAYERFTDWGPMALLPLPDLEGQHRAALVWTLPPDQARTIQDLKEVEFLEQLHRRFGYRAGSFLHAGRRHFYPLKLMIATEQVRRHLVVVGNAAHFLHPVAGQGFNLALRDVARLAEVLNGGRQVNLPPGDLGLLQQYSQRQSADQDRTIFFSDRLPALFGSRRLPLAAGRNMGLIALDLVPDLRQQFARFGAGLANASVKINEQPV